MRVAAVIPTRGDRPRLLANAVRLASAQVDDVVVVDHPPSGPAKDLTARYRIGLERAFGAGADAALLWEDDDWYAPDYAARTVAAWAARGCPTLFGWSGTYYYHLGSRRWTLLDHPGRASAMSTLAAPSVMSLGWPAPSEPFLDVHLWRAANGSARAPEGVLAIGVKHGIGLCGGIGHRADWGGYKNADPDLAWLRAAVGGDDVSMKLYEEISERR